MSRFLRFCAFLSVLFFTTNVFAAGYSCPTYKKYTSCNSGYYMVASSSSTTHTSTAAAGNACIACSNAGSSCTCAGGTAAPVCSVTVTYNLNGGSGTTPSAKSCTPGSSCSLQSGATTSFYRAGYVFNGWSTSSSATTGSTSITVSAATTVYAVWTACANGTFKGGSGTQASAACSSCPTVTSGYSYVSGTGWTSYSSCKETKAYSSVSSYCYSGALTKTATSATAWGTATNNLTAKGGYKVTGSGDSATCSACGYGSYSANGATSCTACPTADSGWTAYSTSNVSTSYSACYEYKSGANISSYCSAGQLRRTASSASAYSTTVSISTALRAKAGSIVSGQTCTQCSGAVWSAGGTATSCSACPAQTSGWTRATGTGWSAVTSCYQTKAATSVSSYCYSGQLKQNATSTTAWGTATVSTAFTADAGAYVTGSGATSSCSQCTPGYYCPGGTTTRQACSDLSGVSVSGGSYTSTAGSSASTACKYTAPSKTIDGCASVTTNTVTYSGTAWPATTYSVTADPGYYIASNGTASATCTICAKGNYCTGGTTAAQATGQTKCPAGTYGSTTGLKTSACSGNCTAGYYCPAGSVSATQNECTAGNYCPAGAGAETSCATVGGKLYVNSAAKSDEATDCYISLASKVYLASATSTSTTTCTAGYYCPGGDFYYSSGATYQGRSSCTGATYSGSGAASCSNCPSGYTANTSSNKTAASSCQISCAAGTRVAEKNALCTSPAGAWYSAATTTNYGSVSPVNYCMAGYTSTSTASTGHDAKSDCTQTIAGGKYVPSTTINARYIKVTTAGSTENAGSHVVEIQAFASADGTGTNLLSGKSGVSGSNMTAATDGSWARSSYASGTMIWDLGSTQALGSIKFALYTDGRTYSDVTVSVSTDNSTYTTVLGPIDILTQNASTAVGELIVLSAAPASCAAGTYKASASLALGNTSSCSVCATNNYSNAGASSCTACATANGYTNSGTDATSHAGIATCKATCGAGQYVATAGSACTNVGAGYWGAGGTVAQNATLARTACASGLTSIGYGTAANEAADCGRKLHAGDNVVYLRSEARTTPSLRVKVGDTTFFGALSTSLSGALKVKKDTTTYSVVNDYQ